MPTSAAEFTGAIPELYDRHLGPLLFEPYARDLAARLAPSPAPRVLEVACGTGIVTRRLCERLGQGTPLVATDLNDAMLAVARRQLRDLPSLALQVADAQALPFPAAHFGAWVCQFGWMFFPDKSLAAREALRVLRPGGRLLLNVWASQRENPLALIVHETLAGLFPASPPDFYCVPFGFHDTDAIAVLLRDAGFRDVEAATVDCAAAGPSAEHAAIGFVRGNPVVGQLAARGMDPELVVNAVAHALRAKLGAGPLRAPMRAHVVAATRP